MFRSRRRPRPRLFEKNPDEEDSRRTTRMRTRSKPRSIASRLILFFTLATALLLVCGLGVFYSLVVRHALAEDNAVLGDKISALAPSCTRAARNFLPRN